MLKKLILLYTFLVNYVGFSQEIRILTIGDSLTKGHYSKSEGPDYSPYTKKLKENLVGEITIDNMGVDSIPTDFFKWILDEANSKIKTVKKNYHITICLGGTNDVASPYEETDSVKNLIGIYEKVVNSGSFLVAMTIPPIRDPSEDSYAFANKKRAYINKSIKEYFKDKITSERGILFDLDDLVSSSEWSEDFWSDSVHFSPIGYDKMGENIAKKIDENGILDRVKEAAKISNILHYLKLTAIKLTGK